MWEQNSLFQKYLEKYGNDHFQIYTLICNHKSGIEFMENKNNRFICEIPLKKEHILLEELNKSCYIKVINRRKKADSLNSIYNDEIF